jgi:hypothetical protein
MLSKLIPGLLGPAEGSTVSASGSGLQDDKGRPWVLHPFLLATFPILSVYYHNVYELPFDVLIVPMGTALASTALVWLALWFWKRDSLRAGLCTSLLVGLFFGYESVRNSLEKGYGFLSGYWVYDELHIPPLGMLALEGCLAILGFWAIFWRINRPLVFTKYLNAFALILVALPTVGVVSSRLREPVGIHRDGVLPTLGKRGATPDIYFIVLDGYARSDVMKDLYGFDNGPFLDRLERRGFAVARQSTSNYCQTQPSLASMLNADYLDKLVDPRSHDLMLLAGRIKRNMVKELVRSQGYQYVTFETGFAPTEDPRSDLYLTSGPSPSIFNQFLIAMTPLAPIASVIFPEARWTDHYSMTRERALFILDRLPSIAKIPGPTFTFAHILSPHPPFVFGENGEDISPHSVLTGQKIVPKTDPFLITPDYVREGYRKQAAFLTSRIDRVIDQILEQSPEPPVIVLQSDHGAWLHYHPNDAESTDLRERFGTLNAILIPGRKVEGFSDDATSVNTFRIVLNNVFGAGMPLLEGRNYFSTIDEPLNFIDVTERLHSEKERTRKFQPPDKYHGLMQRF